MDNGHHEEGSEESDEENSSAPHSPAPRRLDEQLEVDENESTRKGLLADKHPSALYKSKSYNVPAYQPHMAAPYPHYQFPQQYPYGAANY